jgi:hypothetical protein
MLEKIPALENALPAEAAIDRVKIAVSWDKIAGWIGADPAVLKATIDEYNDGCDHG